MPNGRRVRVEISYAGIGISEFFEVAALCGLEQYSLKPKRSHRGL